MSALDRASKATQAAEILSSVNRIRIRHYRETGMRLPLDEAYRLHDIEPDADDTFPDRTALVPARLILVEKGYTDVAISGAISDIARDGTAQASLWIDAEDRDEVEEAIPGNPWMWDGSTDDEVWNLNETL